jgi:hypothetical protein
MAKKQGKDPDDFWREFEEKTGEKVLARSLGQYLSGWDEFDDSRGKPIWGLIITTSGGFRFHHFPQTSWLDAFIRSSGDAPKEKTFFIPNQQIISAEIVKETKWWKRIFSPSLPKLIIKYRNEAGEDRELLVQTEYKSEGLAEQLQPSL